MACLLLIIEADSGGLDHMAESLSHAQSLRVVGQDLDALGVDSFELWPVIIWKLGIVTVMKIKPPMARNSSKQYGKKTTASVARELKTVSLRTHIERKEPPSGTA